MQYTDCSNKVNQLINIHVPTGLNNDVCVSFGCVTPAAKTYKNNTYFQQKACKNYVQRSASSVKDSVCFMVNIAFTTVSLPQHWLLHIGTHFNKTPPPDHSQHLHQLCFKQMLCSGNQPDRFREGKLLTRRDLDIVQTDCKTVTMQLY